MRSRTPPSDALPRIETGELADENTAPLSPLVPQTPLSPGQPSFRRHARKRSSTIYLPPRVAPPPSPQADPAPMTSNLLKGATTLAGAQLLAKLLAFVLNQLLLRFVSAADLGSSARLDLLVATTLALSRDAVRLASQRQRLATLTHVSEYTTDGRAVLDTLVGSLQQTVNLGWAAWTIGSALITATSAWLVMRGMWPGGAGFVYGLAAVLELAAEPCFLMAQIQLRLGLRAKAESLATAARVGMVAVMLVIVKVPEPIVGFAFGQLTYAATIALVYYMSAIAEERRAGFSLLPARVWATQDQTRAVFVGEDVYRTIVELGGQQVVKFFLTEGDKIAVGLMTTLEQQGEYALASNYGSMLARMVLFPVEEALRSYFTRSLPKPKSIAFAPTATNASSASPAISPSASGFPARQNSVRLRSPSLSAAGGSAAQTRATSEPPADATPPELPVVPSGPVTVLTSVLRAYTYLGFLAAGFGPLVSQYVLSWVVDPMRFGNASAVLAAYATYIPILAWNGVLEAVVQSVGSLEQLRYQGYALSAVGIAFVLFVYIFVSILKLGAVGLVYAQILAMAIRTLWSLHFATVYVGKGSPGWLQKSIPPWWVLAVGGAVLGMARYVGEAHTFAQFMRDCVLASVFVCAALFAEREPLKDFVNKFSSRPKA